jgi:hypothetical protein
VSSYQLKREPPKPAPLHRVRVQTLVSEKGSRSYIESSKLEVTDTNATVCGESAALYLAATQNADFENVLSKPANSDWSYVKMDQIDWSQDGRYLLLELRQADSGGERTSNGPLIYDAVARRVISPDILQLFRSRFHSKACGNDVKIEGLTNDGDLVLTTKAATGLRPENP